MSEINIFEELQKPFPASDIEWRVQAMGTKQDGSPWVRVIPYITNRAIMSRLDSVVGPTNWKNEFKPWLNNSVLCGISIRINNEWIEKWDGADETDIEKTKGGISSAMKRTAVQWGIGRYLYNLEAVYAPIVQNGKHFVRGKNGQQSFAWDDPQLPDWALPEGDSVTPDLIKPKKQADKTEPKAKQLPAGNQDQAIKAIGLIANEPMAIKFLNQRKERSWTEEEIKTQNHLLTLHCGEEFRDKFLK